MPDVDTQKSDICPVVLDFEDLVYVDPYFPTHDRYMCAQLFREESGTHGAKL